MTGTEVAPAEILAFWRDAGPDRWYTRDDDFDAGVRERYLGLWQAAVAGELAVRLATLPSPWSRNCATAESRSPAG